MTSELVFLYYRTVCYGDRSVDTNRTDLSVMTSELIFIFYYRTVCYGDRSVDINRTVCYGDRSVDTDRTNTSVMTSELIFFFITGQYAMVIGQLIQTGQIPVS